MKYRFLWLTLAFLFSILATPAAAESNLAPQCIWQESEQSEPGRQHYALLIGIDTYAAVRSLQGAENDVRMMVDYLTEPNGGPGLATANVCALTGANASLENVLQAFSVLSKKIDNKDHVTVYFAGHGSQVADLSGAELDGMDETLVLYNTRALSKTVVDGERLLTPHLTDDAFGRILEVLNDKLTKGRKGAHALTVILDSCNSLSATRGQSTTRFLEPMPRLGDANKSTRRYAPLATYLEATGFGAISGTLEEADRGQSLSSAYPAGAVVLAAAGDGAAALEQGGSGAFTLALLDALRSARKPLTYRQLEWRIRNRLSATYQVPAVLGSADALVFSTELRGAGGGHTVSSVEGDQVQLVGAPVFGLGPDAEFRIYDGASAVAHTPDKAKGIVRVTGDNALTPDGEIVSRNGSEQINPGDIAIMIAPSPDARRLTVLVSSEIDTEIEERFRQTASDYEDTQRGIEFIIPNESGDATAFDLKVSQLPARENASERLAIIDPDGRIRASFGTGSRGVINLVQRLGSFSRQKALRTLKGEGGDTFTPDGEISVSLVPVTERSRSRCRDHIPILGEITQTDALRFEVPLCQRYRYAVEATGLTREVQIGILFLKSDGGIDVIPSMRAGEGANELIRLSPYRSPSEPGNLRQVLPDIHQAYPPLVPTEDVLVFAVDANTPIPWQALSMSMQARRSSTEPSSKNALFRELDAYLNFGLRSGSIEDLDEENKAGAWSVTRAEIRPVAFPSLTPYITGDAGKDSTREYTVSDFRIEPYLPVDNTSSLYKVLKVANELATKSHEFEPTNVGGGNDQKGEGYNYKQHDWCKADDAGNIDFDANLNTGIDCSRSIWYAFTQAGLPYSSMSPVAGQARKACLPYGAKGNDYHATSDMARANSPLAAAFESCDGEALRTGDVLVYRDEDKKVGHTVMVIDPTQRIGWGSHGWDGEGRLGGVPDTGVEYQRIKVKQDWQRWDTQSMKLAACWRHKSFIEEREAGKLYTEGQWSNILCPRGAKCYADAVTAKAEP